MSKTAKALPVQSLFIKKLKENLPNNVGLAEEMADILDISLDSAYRRIRGETDLSVDEVYKLTKKYIISLDSVFSNLSDSVTFTYTKLTDSGENFEQYLNRILTHTKAIAASSDRKIYYVAEEVPMFHSFFSRKLTEFKLFYWQRSVLNVPAYQGQKFEFGKVSEKLVNVASAIAREYNKVPSVEIWTEETILTLTKQVEFYLDSGVFKNRQDAIEVMEDIIKMAHYLEHCSETGRKEISQTEESFQFYNSEVVLGTNCIYVNMNGLNYAYITFNTMNSLTTNNHEFCDETDHWIRNLIKKSTLISGAAEKQRYQFFNKMYQNLEACLQRIKNA